MNSQAAVGLLKSEGVAAGLGIAVGSAAEGLSTMHSMNADLRDVLRIFAPLIAIIVVLVTKAIQGKLEESEEERKLSRYISRMEKTVRRAMSDRTVDGAGRKQLAIELSRLRQLRLEIQRNRIKAALESRKTAI